VARVGSRINIGGGVTVRIGNLDREFHDTIHALRQFGDGKTIKNELVKEIRTYVPPARRAVKARAKLILPHGGGLNVWTSRLGVTSTVHTGARSAGIRLRGRRNSMIGRTDTRSIDAGATRHPTFGHDPWKLQALPSGFFTDGALSELPEFRDGVIRALGNAQRKLGL
jgi:hypothetical protein